MIRSTKGKTFAGDSLFGTVGCYLLCIFYLIPAVLLYPVIGYWSLLAAAGFWAGLSLVTRTVMKYIERNRNDSEAS